MEALLINKTDLSDFKQISRALQVDKADEYIREAQSYDLPELLGVPFLFDVVANRQQPRYQKLIHGGTWLEDGVQYSFNGLRAVIAYFAYSRLVLTVDAVNSPFGMNRKLQPDSEPISFSEKKDIRTMSIQSANHEWSMCVRFIEANKSDYPLFGNGCKHIKRTLKIDKI